MKTNPILQDLINQLKKTSLDEKVKVWKRVAKDLEKPSRIRRKVNLYKLDVVKDGETAVVPGKVLGIGDVSKKLTVASYSFSQKALDKLKAAGCTTMSLQEVLKKNPKGKKVRIIG